MNRGILRRYLHVLVIFLLQGLMLIFSAGTTSWKWAWIFLAVCAFILIINFIVLPADVIEERGSKKKNVKRWDKLITIINAVPTVSLYICSGLDFRFNWTGDVSITIHIMGLILFFLGSMVFTWSMVSNTFFSTLVRIQNDRRHRVATQGPYKYIRHPGYTGYMITSLATPIALGTFWSLVFSGMTVVLFIIRTAFEDMTLKNELDGYIPYSKKVKYRLVPFVW